MPLSYVLEKSFRVSILWLYLRNKDHVRQGDEVLKVPANFLDLNGHLDGVLLGKVLQHQEQVLPVPPFKVDPTVVFDLQLLKVLQAQLWQTYYLILQNLFQWE